MPNTDNNLIGKAERGFNGYTSQQLIAWRTRLVANIPYSTTETIALHRISLANNITLELAGRKQRNCTDKLVLDVWDVEYPESGVAPADRVINAIYRTPLTNTLWRCYRDSHKKELCFIRMTSRSTGLLKASEAKYFEGWTV
jgi:hypothetical protein